MDNLPYYRFLYAAPDSANFQTAFLHTASLPRLHLRVLLLQRRQEGEGCLREHKGVDM